MQQTSRHRVAAALSVLVLVTAGCGTQKTQSQPSATPETSRSATAIGPESSALVGDNGVAVSRVVDGVRVTATAPPGVADPGVALTMSDGNTTVEPYKVEVASSKPVQLVLGSGAQPKQPVTLKFDLSGQPEMAAAFDDSVKPVVRSISADPAVTDLHAATWDPATKTVTATTDHLSFFQVVAVNVGKALNDAAATVGRALWGSPESPCRDKSELTIGSTNLTLTPSKPGPVAACLRDAGGAVGIDFTNRHNQYYSVTSAPAGTFTNPVPLKADDQIMVWLRAGEDKGLLPQEGTGQLVLPAGTTDASIRADVDPVALQLKTVLAGLDMLGLSGDLLVEIFETSRAALDCVTTVGNAMQPADNAAEFRNVLGDIAQCGLAGAGAGVGKADRNHVLHRMSVMTSLFTTLPDQFIANVTGIIGEFTGDNHLEFTLTGEAPQQEPPPPESSSTLVPLVIKDHGSPGDSGEELGPNHFRLGHILKDDGKFYVTLNLRWETNDGGAVAQRCTEYSKIVDSSGQVIVEREQDLGGGCEYGGGWGIRIHEPGTYTYVLDVKDRDTGKTVRAEQQFVVEP